MQLIRKYSPYLFLILLAFAQVADTSSLAKSSRRRNKALYKSHSKSKRGDLKLGQAVAQNSFLNREQILGTPEQRDVWTAIKNGTGFNYFELMLGVVVTQTSHVGTIIDSFWEQLTKVGLKSSLELLVNSCGNQFKVEKQNKETEALQQRQANLNQIPTNQGPTVQDLEADVPVEFTSNANYCPNGRCDANVAKGIPYYLIQIASTWAGLKVFASCISQNVGAWLQQNAKKIGQAFVDSIGNAIKSILQDVAVEIIAKVLGLLFKPLTLIIELIYQIYKFVKELMDLRSNWKQTHILPFYGLGKTIGEGINIIRVFTGRRRKFMRRYRK